MSNRNQSGKNKAPAGKANRNIFITAGIIVAIAALVLIIKGTSAGSASDVNNTASGSDLVISRSEITDTAKFFPTKVGKINMEVLAVKASDGTIRTAFNTCQVCNGSPRAYYKQEGDVLVCQNCGNRFSMDMIEQKRGGCNPIPIMEGEKTDDGTNITIPQSFIEQNKGLFTENWKTQ